MRIERIVQLVAVAATLAAAWGCGATNQPVVSTHPVKFPTFALADTNRNTPTYGRIVTRDSLLSTTFAQTENPGAPATRASVVYFGWST